MNQTYQENLFTFYKDGILLCIESGERIDSAHKRQLKGPSTICGTIPEGSSLVPRIIIKCQKNEIKGEIEPTMNSQRIGTSHGLLANRVITYFNTE